MNRILIVNVNWVGDVLFSTPLIRAVRENFPNAFISCMVVPRCKEMLERNPRLDDIIVYDEDGRHRSALGKLRLISHIRSKKFDTALILHRSMTRALMVFLAGIPKRVGYYTPKRAFLLTDCIEMPPEDTHRVDFFLHLAEAAGIKTSGREYEFFISNADRARAGEFLKKNGIQGTDLLIALNAGGNWEPKRWPAENFAKLSDALTKRFKAKIILTGATKDCELGGAISAAAGMKPVIACGKTSLKELAAIFEKCRLVISNDSGPMHIAVSMGAKTIALFGPTSPQITGPIGKGEFIVLHKHTGCEIPCYNLACADYKCMEAIKVEDVVEAAGKILA